VKFFEQIKRWWGKAPKLDKKWTYASALAFVACIVSWRLYDSSRNDVIHYLTTLGDPGYQGFTADLAAQVTAYSLKEVELFLCFLAVSLMAVILTLSGAWAGRRSKWAWIFFSAILMCDLSRADWPWVRYFDYTEKYSMNPVTDFLRKHPYEGRVIGPRLSPQGDYKLTGDANFGAMCHWWIENDFPYNDIQCLDIDQWPRMPILETQYIGAFNATGQGDLPLVARLWQLTNTRYILASAGAAQLFNQSGNHGNSFLDRYLFTFTGADGQLLAKPGVKLPEDSGDVAVQLNDKGPFSLIEFTNALPRAKLYANWQSVGDDATLGILRSPGFDPLKTVLVSTDTPLAQAPGNPNADAGTVTISSYEPKDVKLTARAAAAAVLLLNERMAAAWKVTVDGKPAAALRCNYLMQGVFVPAGEHAIEFRFQPPILPVYVSLAAFASGLMLAAFLMYTHWCDVQAEPDPPPPSAPTPPPTPSPSSKGKRGRR
jgi:hypothetical protein